MEKEKQIIKALKYASSTSNIERMKPQKNEMEIIKKMLKTENNEKIVSIVINNIKTKKKEIK